MDQKQGPEGAQSSFPLHQHCPRRLGWRVHDGPHTHPKKNPHDQASFIRGGGYFGQDPPTQLWTHPAPPPPLIILWGAFFVNQIEAKALSRFRHPQRVELQLSSLTTGLPTSSDRDVQQRVHRFNMLSKKRPPCEKLPPAHLPPAQRHNRKGHQQTARQGSCDQRKKVWQEPNPGNPQNYKRGGGSRALDPPTRVKTHPPRSPPHCNLILINEACP